MDELEEGTPTIQCHIEVRGKVPLIHGISGTTDIQPGDDQAKRER